MTKRSYTFKPVFPPEDLHELFSYEPDTGLLRWRVSRSSRAPVGSIAGSLSSSGYLDVMFSGHRKGVHLVIWAMMTGAWPVEVDHWNRVKNDNRWGNLREVTRSINNTNSKVRSDNRSGVKFVRRGRTGWIVSRRIKGVYLINRQFPTFEAAAAVAAGLGSL